MLPTPNATCPTSIMLVDNKSAALFRYWQKLERLQNVGRCDRNRKSLLTRSKNGPHFDYSAGCCPRYVHYPSTLSLLFANCAQKCSILAHEARPLDCKSHQQQMPNRNNHWSVQGSQQWPLLRCTTIGLHAYMYIRHDKLQLFEQ